MLNRASGDLRDSRSVVYEALTDDDDDDDEDCFCTSHTGKLTMLLGIGFIVVLFGLSFGSVLPRSVLDKPTCGYEVGFCCLHYHRHHGIFVNFSFDFCSYWYFEIFQQLDFEVFFFLTSRGQHFNFCWYGSVRVLCFRNDPVRLVEHR